MINVDYEIQCICKSNHSSRVYNRVADYLIHNNAIEEMPRNLVELSIIVTKAILDLEDELKKGIRNNAEKTSCEPGD